jgi:hypothetical protein
MGKNAVLKAKQLLTYPHLAIGPLDLKGGAKMQQWLLFLYLCLASALFIMLQQNCAPRVQPLDFEGDLFYKNFFRIWIMGQKAVIEQWAGREKILAFLA